DLYFLAQTTAGGNHSGSVKFVGKLNGNMVFQIIKSTGFVDAIAAIVQNGYTHIDFATAGSSDYTNTNIDELEIITSYNADIVQIDAFRWGAPVCNLSAITSQTNLTCNGSGDGSVTVTVANGSPGYNYVWSNNLGSSSSSNTHTISNLDAGTYSV